MDNLVRFAIIFTIAIICMLTVGAIMMAAQILSKYLKQKSK